MKRVIANEVLGETVTFLETESESAGKHSRLLMTLEPGGGTPLHYHTSYEETYTALEGTLGLELPRKRILSLQPGQSYTVPIGEVHRLFNDGPERNRFLNVVSAGHVGFENTLRILSGLAADGEYDVARGVPRRLSDLALCAQMSDMRLPGLASLAMPALRLIARLSSSRRRELLDRYCGESA